MAELTTRGERTEFVSEVIKRRGFIRAKYRSWEEPRNGLVTFASKDYLRVLTKTAKGKLFVFTASLRRHFCRIPTICPKSTISTTTRLTITSKISNG